MKDLLITVFIVGILLNLITLVTLNISLIDFISNASFMDIPMSGVRCPTCAANGQEVWVIPGKNCAYCGTGC